MSQPQVAGAAYVRRAERRLAAGEESDRILADLDRRLSATPKSVMSLGRLIFGGCKLS